MKINYFFIFLMLVGCKKDIQNNNTPPTPIVYTVPIIDYTNVQSISSTSAKCLVNISSNGGKEIVEKGVCYSETNSLPNIKDIKLVSSSSLNNFSVDITSLKENTYYYVRSYAVNSIGIVYSEVNKFKTLSATPPPVPSTIIDYDGNVYNVIKIGDQYWTKENFRGEHYQDGTEIQLDKGLNDFESATTGRLGWFLNYLDGTKMKNYGGYYNWYAVKTKQLAPSGWHVPTIADINKLKSNLTSGMEGQEIKDMAWRGPSGFEDTMTLKPNRNKSGFSALPFENYKGNSKASWPSSTSSMMEAYFWISDEKDVSNAYFFSLSSYLNGLNINSLPKNNGYSIRFVKD